MHDRLHLHINVFRPRLFRLCFGIKLNELAKGQLIFFSKLLVRKSKISRLKRAKFRCWSLKCLVNAHRSVDLGRPGEIRCYQGGSGPNNQSTRVAFLKLRNTAANSSRPLPIYLVILEPEGRT